MAKINLLPWRQARRERQKKEFVMAALAGVLLTVVIMSLWHFVNMRITTLQQERIGRLNTEIKLVDKMLKEIKDIDTTRQRLQVKIDVIQKLQRSRPESVHLMDEMVVMMPEGVLLDKIKQSGKRIDIEGNAQSNTRVSALMRNIAESEWIGDPRLQVIENRQAGADAGINRFKLIFSQKSKVEGGE